MTPPCLSGCLLAKVTFQQSTVWFLMVKRTSLLSVWATRAKPIPLCLSILKGRIDDDVNLTFWAVKMLTWLGQYSWGQTVHLLCLSALMKQWSWPHWWPKDVTPWWIFLDISTGDSLSSIKVPLFPFVSSRVGAKLSSTHCVWSWRTQWWYRIWCYCSW